MIQRREPPRRLGSSPMGMKNFVARTTSSRRSLRALPTISSDSPAEQTSAVSMKLIPASSARWMIRTESSWSVLPQAPNIIVPRQSGETWTPVRPSGRYSMRSGLRDGHAEAFERDGFGLRPAALASVQCVDGGDLVGGELEVEDVDVLGDAVRL